MWHLCLEEIVESVRRTDLRGEALAQEIERNIAALNQRLTSIGRRPVDTRDATTPRWSRRL